MDIFLVSNKCLESHEPNELTKKAIESARNKKDLKVVTALDELFKDLD